MKFKSKLKLSRLIRRSQIPVAELEIGKCENCEFEFRGHYCPNCGQEVAEFNRPVGFVFYDFVGNFFAFDTRFLRTFWYLISKPGFLTSEFFKGHRVRYSPPFRIFVFLSFVLFLLFQIYSERSLDQLAEVKTVKSENVMNSDPEVVLKSEITMIDSLQKDLPLLSDSLKSENKLTLNGNDYSINSGNFREKLNGLADQFELDLAKSENPVERKKLSSYIAMCRAPELAISKILKDLSWAFFILLPVFALILKLFYVRRKQLYIKHLIFSIHLHSFYFFVLILVVSLSLIFDSHISTIRAMLLTTFPVYTFIALRKFYGQSFGKVLLKFTGLTILYNILLWSAVLFVFIESLGII